MTITRTINGSTVEIELTLGEIIMASIEYARQNMAQDVKHVAYEQEIDITDEQSEDIAEYMIESIENKECCDFCDRSDEIIDAIEKLGYLDE